MLNIKDKSPINEKSEINLSIPLQGMNRILDGDVISCHWNAPKAKNGVWRILLHLAEYEDKSYDAEIFNLSKLEGFETYHCIINRESVHYVMDRGHVMIMMMPKDRTGFFPKEIWLLTPETLGMFDNFEKYKKYLELQECNPK